jgi:aspartyl-tRNA(Asn)/glutamyl-tRNA(Gln) amidotransferase subunit B
MLAVIKFSSDVVIGLEIHVELNTKTKLFCGCTRVGSVEPNTRTCPICLGHPGSKPVLNRKAIEKALMLSLAVGGEIAPRLIFSRKSYFYPDMAKNFQISQYEIPLSKGGKIRLAGGNDIELTRIHMEEDPAALIHQPGFSLVDYNRSGNPLVEVVTEPELKSPGEARDFMKQLISILGYLGIFDPDSIIKADANVSIKESGYVRAEIKNITGFKEIERALNYEVARQKKDIKEGKKLIQETRQWDADVGITKPMRVKETEEDYGYIIEPDLVATPLPKELISQIRAALPELAQQKSARFVSEYGLPPDDAQILSAQIEMAVLYEKVAAKVSPVLAAKWMRRELSRVMNYNEMEFSQLKIDEGHLIALLSMVEKKEITDTVAQKLMEKLVVEPFDVKAYVEKEGLKVIKDSGRLDELCKKAISENPKAVEEYKAGAEKALNFIIGKVMKETRGTASPQEVRERLLKFI